MRHPDPTRAPDRAVGSPPGDGYATQDVEAATAGQRADGRGWSPILGAVLAGAVVAAFGWAVWSVIAVPAPFSYDESVYAAHARHLLEGTPDTTWRPHRAPALPLLGTLVLQTTDSERGFRLLGLGFGVLALAAVGWLAHTIARTAAPPRRDTRDGGAAVIAAGAAMGALALAPPVVESAARFLTDLPAAGLLALAAAVLWRSLEPHPAPTWALLAAPPLLALAFYLRYGSALFVALLLLMAVLLWGRRMLRNPAPVLAAGALLVALLLPHLVVATREFGAPWGRVLHMSRSVAAGLDRPGEGLLDYLRMLPFDLAGPVAGPVMIAGGLFAAALLLLAAVRGRWTSRERAGAFLTVPAIAHVAVIGWRSPAEVRFLFPTLALLAVAGGLVLHQAIGRLVERGRPGVRLTAALASYGLAVTVVAGLVLAVAPGLAAGRASYARKFGTVQAVALEIAERSEAECFVVTSYAAQVLWYSRCGTARFQRIDPGLLTAPEIVVGNERFDTETRWIALFDRGTRQPSGDELAAYLEVTGPEPDVAVAGARRMAWGMAYRVDPRVVSSIDPRDSPSAVGASSVARRPRTTDVFRRRLRSLPP